MTRSRQIIHVDMDAFYASIEQRDNPNLVGKAVIVGGDPEGRGVVSAASYKAREYGVHSAMPMSRAIRLCPNAVILPVRMDRYIELSQQIHAIFESFTPTVEPVSIDEAFLDVTSCIRLFGSAETIGNNIKTSIRDNLGLTASVGIAPNKFLAKVASDLEKPDGFVIITEENKQNILDPLLVSRIWGVGKVTAKALQSQGIETVFQLRHTSSRSLQSILGNQTHHILDLAQGIDEREVEPISQTKSISSEHTFAADVDDQEVLLSILMTQVEEVAGRLRSKNLTAKTITLKLRYGDFKTITRSNTFALPTNSTPDFPSRSLQKSTIMVV